MLFVAIAKISLEVEDFTFDISPTDLLLQSEAFKTFW